MLNPIPLFDLRGNPVMPCVANNLLVAEVTFSLHFMLLSKESNGIVFVGRMPDHVVLLN